jgi:anti-anti-sigma regulatory factor
MPSPQKRIQTMMVDPAPVVRIGRSERVVTISFLVTTIDERNFSLIVDQLEEVVRIPTPQLVTIDLTGVRRIDELGMTVLQSVRDSIKEVGGTVTLIRPPYLILPQRNPSRLPGERSNQASRCSQPLWTY